MIEKDITTWAEFKTALTEEITEETTYNIKNDLDATNDILTKNIEVNYSKIKIFKGNGYKINGITAYGNVTVFYNSNYTVTQFYDIKFTNFMIESGTFTNLCRSSSVSNKFLFENCFFNGVCKVFVAVPDVSFLTYFNKCSFNVRCETFAKSGRCSFISCYIITTPLQDKNLFTESILIDCYIDGMITATPTTSKTSFITPDFEGNNVFNCKVIVTNSVESRMYYLNSSSKAVLVNKNKLLQRDGITPITNIADADNIYLLTDEQMKNKDYIQKNTTFPLYG